MTLSVGDRIPDVTLMRMTGEGPAPVGSAEALGSGTVVLFGVPGAFTPTCSDHHLPGYVRRADELRAKGVDTVCDIPRVRPGTSSRRTAARAQGLRVGARSGDHDRV